jgi:DNA-directed RNA polymerase specialized sigma24 family protein
MKTLVNSDGLIKLSDIELFEQLCSKEEDHALYNQFTVRFLPDIKDACQRICITRKLDSHIGIEIAHNTFERARQYKSFRKDKITIPNNRKAVVVYLKRIATRLFADHHRNEKSKEVNHKTYLDDIFESIETTYNEEELKYIRDQSVRIFNKLNWKEKRVVLTDIEYKRHHKYLPDDAVGVLSKELNVKPATIRKIRERAIEKIKATIHEINQR